MNKTVLFICLLLFAACNRENKPYANVDDLSVQVLISDIREDTSIIDAIYTDVGFLYVAVRNDGKDKNPLAAAHCRMAKDALVMISAVKIVDVTTLKKGPGWASGKELGRSSCD